MSRNYERAKIGECIRWLEGRGHAATALNMSTLAHVRALTAENTSLREEVARLRELLKPNMYWMADDPEQGYDSPADLADATGETSLVFEVQRAASLPGAWVAAHYDEDEGWQISEHETEADADNALATALNNPEPPK